jgi:hypothetical protein
MEFDGPSAPKHLRDQARRARRLALEAGLQEKDARGLLLYAQELEERAAAAEERLRTR